MTQRIAEIPRALEVAVVPNPVKGSGAAFLLGPRKTGKTTLLKQRFPDATYFDLLDTELAAELAVRPRTLRERLLAAPPATVVIDEIQQAPGLLEEVHFLLENTSIQFVICGSSARKLKRKAPNLLGGRAVEYHLGPLTSAELPDLDLRRMLNHGGLPAHYLVDSPAPLLRSYVSTYIKQEVIDESLTRNVPAFARFLEIVGLTHGRQLNYANVARESGVSAGTVRGYYQILEDTLLGFELQPWRRSRKRRMVETAKFYLFDIGLANALHPELRRVDEGTDAYGRAFEHFLINEVRAYLEYRGRDDRLSYWRTSSGLEVDLVIGDMDVALELKSTREIRRRDLKGLRALLEERQPREKILVSRVAAPRRTEDGIDIVPWRQFCARLWGGDII
jgi:predicted AAA+ superfamily ATPase